MHNDIAVQGYNKFVVLHLLRYTQYKPTVSFQCNYARLNTCYNKYVYGNSKLF